MTFAENWIWLPKELYPDKQTTKYSAFIRGNEESYAVAEFQRIYTYDKKVTCARLRFSGDTEFRLCLNGAVLATGPVTVEGDFIGNDTPRPNFYATELTVFPDSNRLEFYALVKQMPVRICEYSKGHGGFMLMAELTFSDGSETVITTDETWQVRYNGAYTSPFHYDGRIAADAFVFAEIVDNIWHTTVAPLKVRTEKEVFPAGGNTVIVPPHEEKAVVLELDMIYAGFLHLRVKTEGELCVHVFCRETEEQGSEEALVFETDTEYRGLQLHSAGKLVLTVKNGADTPAEVAVGLITTYYPIEQEAKTTTGDGKLNQVLAVCAHTLKYCRQLHHLDSPRHCEPLACTGDYYIESLMTAMSFGDMTLAEFDVLRTAELLRHNDGRMFHTTYSLIWVRMLYDVYMITGKKELLAKCEDALKLLLNRFETYIGENGLVETPPDYMFVDWIYIDGLSMHHPPKALGQTCLNMFYFGALDFASKIYEALLEPAMAAECAEKREAIKCAVNSLLFDESRGLYFEGLNTETPEALLGTYMPPNTDKRYYLKHSNILAAYFGICGKERAKELIHKIMTDECPGDYQPYFAHYLLEAIYDNGLREVYTLQVLEQWKAPVENCSKGLVEGFIAPEPTYHFDHSHAWGGTPLYSLPKALLGLKILKPGMQELELSPSLLGLQSARVELPTPLGTVVCEMNEKEKPHVTHPDAIAVCIAK